VKVDQIARDLGVRYILEGSVRRAEDRVRINAQLIDCSTGGHLWAERYDGTIGDIFGLQDRITQKIVSALAVKLTASEEDHITRMGTDNVWAYDAFLKGWEHHRRRTPEDFEKAISYFEEAIELDPKYGRAYAALALAFWKASFRADYWEARVGPRYREIRMRASEFLQMALSYPISLAHVVNSHYVLESHRRHEEAIAEAQRAMALDPNDPSGYDTLAYALIMAGRPEEAVDFAKKAMRLDPHSPGDYLFTLGLAHFAMGQLEEAVSLIERALTHNPQASVWAAPLAAAYAHLGRDKEAWDALVKYSRGEYMLPSLERVMWYWPFRDMEVSERFVDGLLEAGLPGEPSQYYRIQEDNRLTGEEIKALVFGRKVTGRIGGQKWWQITTKDGKWTRDSSLSGTASIEGDLLCLHWQSSTTGDVNIRHAIFCNPEGKPETNDEYLSLTDHIEIWPWSPTD
jgi:tetratricopeptide (TPR) repeat protein